MSNLLPHDLITEILSRLPVKSLLRFRCVCKSWCALIRNPRFVNMHLKRSTENRNFNLMGNDFSRVYSLNYDVVLDDNDGLDNEIVEIDYPFKSSDNESRIWGPCNGLLCVTIIEYSGHDVTCFWNPSTKEYKKVPTAPIRSSEGYTLFQEIYGFGYDCINDDYKFVIIYVGDDNTYCNEVIVYTLGSDSWRRIDDMPYDLTYSQLPGEYVNGALHWVAFPQIGWERSDDMVIVSIGLGDEEYHEVPQANYSDDDKKLGMTLGVLEGCLCVIRKIYNTRIDVWIMKDYGVRESWTKLFAINQPMLMVYFNDMSLIKIDKYGEILLNDGNAMSVGYYNPKTDIVRVLEIRSFFEAYVGSLVSLNSGTYVGQAQ